MSARDFVEKDYYAALGVAKDAPAAEIKKAYRKLARELHPDKNPGDAKAEARFKEISEAYDVLSDDARRKEYDEARALFGAGAGRRGFGPRAGAGAGGNSFSFDLGDIFGARTAGAASGNLGDLLGGIFSQRGGGTTSTGRGPRRGADLASEVTVSFQDAMRGLETSVRLPGAAACDACSGTGAKAGTTPRTCPTCHGSGLTTTNQGGFAFSAPCRDCRGEGTIIDDPCPVCHGTGRRERLQKIRLPAGVADGQKVRVRGRGGPGERGGPAGDLEVIVRVRPHPVFGRDGQALTLTLPVTFPEAALGATVTVPTLDDPVTLKVPAGTQNGARLRVRHRGFPGKSGRGDLIVTVQVAVPRRLSGAAREALEKYAAEATEDPRPHLTGMLGGEPS